MITNTNKKSRKDRYTVRKELVGSPVEEWYEYRVYRGKVRIASYNSGAKADALVWALTH